MIILSLWRVHRRAQLVWNRTLKHKHSLTRVRIFGVSVRIRTSSTNSYSIRRRVWHGYPEPIKVIWY